MLIQRRRKGPLWNNRSLWIVRWSGHSFCVWRGGQGESGSARGRGGVARTKARERCRVRGGGGVEGGRGEKKKRKRKSRGRVESVWEDKCRRGEKIEGRRRKGEISKSNNRKWGKGLSRRIKGRLKMNNTINIKTKGIEEKCYREETRKLGIRKGRKNTRGTRSRNSRRKWTTRWRFRKRKRRGGRGWWRDDETSAKINSNPCRSTFQFCLHCIVISAVVGGGGA